MLSPFPFTNSLEWLTVLISLSNRPCFDVGRTNLFDMLIANFESRVYFRTCKFVSLAGFHINRSLYTPINIYRDYLRYKLQNC